MNDEENKIIEKIEKLIALSGSDNENEAKAAMLKAQELMAKYEIEQDRIDSERKKERPVVCFTSPMFRDDWCVDVGSLIANNFRCRAIISQRRNSGGAYRLKFFGFEEDAEISINVFNYAVKVIRKRMATLRAIYRDAEREFGRNEKMAYVDGFCSGLYRNFEEQKNKVNPSPWRFWFRKQLLNLSMKFQEWKNITAANISKSAKTTFFARLDMLTERRSRTPATRNGWRMNLDKFAGGELTRLIRKGINEILDNIRDEGTTPQARRTLTVKITFRPAKDRKNMKIQIETRVNKAPVRATETNMFIGQELDGSPAFYTSDEQIPGQMRITEGG